MIVHVSGWVGALWPSAVPKAQNPPNCGAYFNGSDLKAARFPAEEKYQVAPFQTY
jgi:hypothetical protein